jgi:hypothetical protein
MNACAEPLLLRASLMISTILYKAFLYLSLYEIIMFFKWVVVKNEIPLVH